MANHWAPISEAGRPEVGDDVGVGDGVELGVGLGVGREVGEGDGVGRVGLDEAILGEGWLAVGLEEEVGVAWGTRPAQAPAREMVRPRRISRTARVAAMPDTLPGARNRPFATP